MKSDRGWRGDKAEHARFGARGGRATAITHGKDFYAEIGRAGGKVSGGNFKRNRDRARLAGKKGVEARRKKKASEW